MLFPVFPETAAAAGVSPISVKELDLTHVQVGNSIAVGVAALVMASVFSCVTFVQPDAAKPAPGLSATECDEQEPKEPSDVDDSDLPPAIRRDKRSKAGSYCVTIKDAGLRHVFKATDCGSLSKAQEAAKTWYENVDFEAAMRTVVCKYGRIDSRRHVDMHLVGSHV